MHRLKGQQGYGGLGMLFAGMVFGVLMYFYFYPAKFTNAPWNSGNSSYYCRPYVEDDGSIKPDAPTIMAPSYTYDTSETFPVANQDLKPYRLIKANVFIDNGHITNYFSKNEFRSVSQNEIKCPDLATVPSHHSHFCQWVHEPVTVGKGKFAVLFPAPYSEPRFNGSSATFNSTEGPDQKILFADYQILFLVHLKDDLTPVGVLRPTRDGILNAVDVYQRVDEGNPSRPIRVLPSSALNCIDNNALSSGMQIGNIERLSEHKAEEQLGYFLFSKYSGEEGWYYPACKPAVYLYPEKEQLVNVQVHIPQGFLTYTDPVYPQGGWQVMAKPSGELRYLGNSFADSKGTINYATGIFPYLYYEGKIADSAVVKPEKGFVKRYEELGTFFDELLPKLGLQEKEAQEFKQYWLKALQRSSYYFIGILPQEQINEQEPLSITPREDSLIRVRLYFESLDKPQRVQAPEIVTPQRDGFTVVDWGGIVKTDSKHPFTCVQ